jgi:L-lactate dehydrogenase complex protein LldE
VGRATLRLLQRHAPSGASIHYPEQQTCCGQPMLNLGCADAARPAAAHFVRTFADFDAVVTPSGSCTAMIRRHYAALLEAPDPLPARVFELCQFLVEELGVTSTGARFPHRVGLHRSCHGLRDLGLGGSSERRDATPDPAERLLRTVQDLHLVEPQRRDECCGFGGTFAVSQAAVSCAMGRDRIAEYAAVQAEVIAGGDASCLMHLDGLLRRRRSPQRVLHVAQILDAGHAA